MSAFFTPYEGKRPYLFISYSHRNSQEVLETITLLHQRKVRLWYDEGIPAGNDWPKNIETHMRCSAMVLFFLSRTALASSNCRSEIETAVALKKSVLYFALDDSRPEPGSEWETLLKSCLPLPTPGDAKARADQVTRHKKLKGAFYRKWWEKLPRGLFGFLLSAILFGAALAGAYGVYAGWWDQLIYGGSTPTPSPTATATATPAPTPTATPDATGTPPPTPSFPPGMDEVDFPDTDQEKAVRVILGTVGATEKIKLNELAAVTELAIVGNMYAPDLEHTAFTHRGECQVNGTKPLEGKVQDLSVIGKMAYLEKLALVYQPLSSARALSGLVMLQELYLSGDRSLETLTGLTDLPRLETLHLEHSGVRDLSPLAELPSLKTVTVSADMLPLVWPETCDFTVVLVP